MSEEREEKGRGAGFSPDGALLLALRVVLRSSGDGKAVFLADETSDRAAASELAAQAGFSAEFESIASPLLERELERLHEETLGGDAGRLGEVILFEEGAPYLSGRRQSRVEMLVRRALDEGASDIHLQPSPAGLLVRLRVDGLLRTAEVLPSEQGPELVAQVKVLARLPLAGRRLPHDGRLSLVLSGRRTDLRVSIVPSTHGEAAVLRLEGGEAPFHLGALEMPDGMREELEKLLARRGGLILAAGPTGSGKTATLYAMMRHLAGPQRKLVSVEEPVEQTLEGVCQVPVEKGGMGFSDAIRAMLRHAPDAMMVGEIRDGATASAAAEAALTGHLVLATVHARDGAEAVLRLADLGVPREVVACVVSAALSQRLVRRLCPECARILPPSPALARALGLSAEESARCRAPAGCPACSGTGFRGRRALFSLMSFSPALRESLARGAGVHALRSQAESSGMETLAGHARRLSAAGAVLPGEAAVAAGIAQDDSALP